MKTASAMDKMFGKDDITVTLHNKYDENGNEIIIRYKDLKSKILELNKSFINGEYQDDKEVVKLKNELIKDKEYLLIMHEMNIEMVPMILYILINQMETDIEEAYKSLLKEN